MNGNFSINSYAEQAKAKGEFVSQVRATNRALQREGYSAAELGLRSKKRRTKKKIAKKKKDEFEADLFTLPDHLLEPVGDEDEEHDDDEALIYDEDEEDDDD